MRATPPLAAVLFTLALSSAGAHHCTSWTTSTTDEDTLVIDLGTTPGLGIRYFVNDLCGVPRVEDRPGNATVWFGHEFARVPTPVTLAGPDCLFSFYFYFETNGIEGLQRGDEVVDDSCHRMIESDIFLW